MPPSTILAVRFDDLDVNGHVRGPAYLAYADHARWELVRAAGVSVEAFAEAGVGPVNLETTVRFRQELRPGDELAVVTDFTYANRTGAAHQLLHRVADGVLVAEVDSVTGLLDLETRRLADRHAGRMRALATDPSLLGL